MRTIERASVFKRDFKRAKAVPRHNKDVDARVSAVVALLVSDQVLPENHRDHALSGDWVGYRECHIKSDLLLIYQTSQRESAHVPRGPYSQLFVLTLACNTTMAFSTAQERSSDPRWSPEGARIAYSGKLGEQSAVGPASRPVP